MRRFDDIVEIARQRHGEAAMHGYHGAANPKTPAELAAIPDDRYLAMATRCIFQAGFNWKVIEAKWDGFEAAFERFDLGRWVLSSDDDIAELLSDKRIVRNGQKIATVPANARFFAQMSSAHGGVGRWIGDWPVTDLIGLLDALDKGGSRLGAATGQYFLRFMGKDSFILSKDVTAALIREGVIDKPATSQKAKAAVQAAFNRWHEESGQPMTAISQTLARSIDG
ncbi:MAG: DNA-3-methyladenine glycosylase I [Pseudomonadota bacterium]|nr:DNA-3-methyladenine glycosylase I [Pseudomonadota bacterium]